ncbi:flagellar basal body P-ring formation protein FlgA [Campylobacter sp. VicNov18]|uniref:flagellar basal body P-ring formation chaperone FlgA n=1 Tax=Campylobacter bilis TaxID=2691918 RepID=UPI00130E1D47|nr:flagellar basal body P-ring formation chaperone FlgA [Campylobacter bilis]MPV63613.1 flagellar basal body P-ring formation protein FlgA [Campylobacter hepaticus]MBM0637113.1 flagellar basal body P-ring formation protein FlgA [Campylobacter bilis]MCC8277728.1 flagellar basal body P-ring formation protein FlgA [Campylobacter bilis]MCC8299337.1 flagellar basal body P-ring formation protein FlgA [Campylobacter bilis]MCC8300637.1 flagellar basal body P-ring formation protein FlgA [Campylobacter 
MKIIFLTLFILLNFSQASNLEEVKAALEKEFKNNFPKIIISQIDLKITSLPKDFEQYEFLRIAKGRFNQAQGFLRAKFKTPQNIQKNIFFRYFIQANLEVLKNKRFIKKGDKLDAFDYENVLVDFDKVPSNALTLDDVNNLIAKSNINKNTILKITMFKITTLIRRNDPIIGILNEGNVNVLIELVALENANMGERIRAKNKEGKIMQGIVIGKNRIIIQ